VEVRDLSFGYRRKQAVLRGVSLGIPAGRLTMVLGASGSGKTTLLKLVKGLARPDEGEVCVLGAPLRFRGPRGRLDGRVAYIPQQLGLVRSRSVLDNTLAGALASVPAWRGLTGMFPRDVVEQARQTLDALGVGHKANDKVRMLSGGERQRVAIARALVQSPQVLLADEFVSQLDPVTTAEIMTLVQGVAASGVTVLMTTHELDLIARFAEWVIVLRNGEKVLDCAPGAVTAEQLAAVMRA
jgi:phosphonate transport system ATP-binding protein